jgi:hypothetical protein
LNRDAVISGEVATEKLRSSVVELDKHRRMSPKGDGVDSDFHNDDVGCSQVVINGSLSHTLPELLQTHRTIELLEAQRLSISKNLVELYHQGLSLSDLSKQIGLAKSTVRDELVRAGITFRPAASLSVADATTTKGKGNMPPPYGFCYFQGKIVPDPREHGNLLLIRKLWKSEANPNRIANVLNEKKIKPRIASAWNRNSVVNILTRFENGQFKLKGGQIEFR